jgi:hypothetical protein
MNPKRCRKEPTGGPHFFPSPWPRPTAWIGTARPRPAPGPLRTQNEPETLPKGADRRPTPLPLTLATPHWLDWHSSPSPRTRAMSARHAMTCTLGSPVMPRMRSTRMRTPPAVDPNRQGTVFQGGDLGVRHAMTCMLGSPVMPRMRSTRMRTPPAVIPNGSRPSARYSSVSQHDLDT